MSAQVGQSAYDAKRLPRSSGRGCMFLYLVKVN